VPIGCCRSRAKGEVVIKGQPAVQEADMEVPAA
jgi:hypothetical protein